MKILIAGEGRSDIHEKALGGGFQKAGHEVEWFSWLSYFSTPSIFSRLQNRFLVGPKISALNRDFLAHFEKFEPEIVFLYRPTHLFASNVRKVSQRATCAIYNNDDPFSKRQPHYFWRHFFAAVPHADYVFAYRKHNIDDFRGLGIKNVDLLRSWFLPDRDKPMILTEGEKKRFGSDVLFAGHFEPDGRADMLDNLKKRGVQLRVFGPGWDSPALRGEEYVKALCASKIALCFLSKLNRDTYTRRCFEIPATRTFLLSEYSPDLASLFVESKEAEFFRSLQELDDKITFYLKNESARKQIAEAGHARVWKDGHDVDSRAKQVLSALDKAALK